MIQGIFGIVPIYLIELSPPAFRTFVVGTAYNLGVLIASPIPVVDTQIGERFPIRPSQLNQKFDYSIGMAIFLGCAFMYLVTVTFFSTENRAHGDLDDEHVPGSQEMGLDVSSPVMLHGKW
jgi:MFS transporter, SHS family, lactate transporter